MSALHHRTILGFDTSGPQIAAALWHGDRVIGQRMVETARGQAEHLMPVLEQLLSDAGMAWRDLNLLGVGIGPGNFTGVRIAVSAARGLRLSLGIPAFGVSSFELMRDPEALGAHAAELVSIEAPRGQAYVQAFRYGAPQSPPELIDPATPPEAVRLGTDMRVTGFRAAEIAQPFGAEWEDRLPEEIGPRLCRIVDWRAHHLGETPDRPTPLYVRPADAAPPSDPPPVILD